MGLWVLEPTSNERVPGTVHLHSEGEEEDSRNHTANLKHGSGRHSNIVLVPQPSDSPNDPLSMLYLDSAPISVLTSSVDWSQATKWYHALFLSAGTGLMAGTHNFVNPSNALMAKLFKTDIATISRSVSIILLTLGASAVVTSPAARIWGKRPGMPTLGQDDSC